MEIFPYLPDKTVYAFFFRRSDGFVRRDNATWEAFVDATWASYDFALTELGTSSGVYSISLPSGLSESEVYDVIVYERLGGAAAISDTLIGQGDVGPTLLSASVAAASPGSSFDQGLGDLQAEVGQFLGYGRTSANWSVAQTNLIDALVQSGLRRFYWPPPLPGQPIAHEWSFIKPTTTLTLSAAYSTGTVTIVLGVATLAGGTFPTWAASGVLKVAGLVYTVNTRDTGTQLTLDDLTVAASALTSYELSQEDYDAPDAFGHLEGSMTYAPNLRWPPIQVVGEGVLRQMRQSGDGSTGTPRCVAVRSKAVPASTSVGQRFQFMFSPAPDTAFTISYRYAILPDKLTTSNAMPYGGTAMSETLLEACLSVAEERMNDTRGVHYQSFMERLASAIAFDSRNRPDTLGYAYDRSDDDRGGRGRSSYHGITYNSVQY